MMRSQSSLLYKYRLIVAGMKVDYYGWALVLGVVWQGCLPNYTQNQCPLDPTVGQMQPVHRQTFLQLDIFYCQESATTLRLFHKAIKRNR